MLSLLLVMSFSSAQADDTPQIKEGLYEVSMRADMPKIPGLPKEVMKKMMENIPVDKNQQCITKEDFIPGGKTGDKETKCRFINRSISKKKVSWQAECTNENGVSTSKGSITYQKTSFVGSIQVKSAAMNMTTHVSGKYIGACKK